MPYACVYWLGFQADGTWNVPATLTFVGCVFCISGRRWIRGANSEAIHQAYHIGQAFTEIMRRGVVYTGRLALVLTHIAFMTSRCIQYGVQNGHQAEIATDG